MIRKDTLRKIGLKVGHYTDNEGQTGLTVFLAEKGATIGIDVRGSSVGSFNLTSYGSMTSSRELLHGLVLAGGSTPGLESCFGVIDFLKNKKIGERYGSTVHSGVAGAVIYDLSVGSRKAYPNFQMGAEASLNASFDELRQGSIGVGTGATTGKWLEGKLLKGGFGMSEMWINSDIGVAAFVVTNALGDILSPETGKFIMDEGGYAIHNTQKLARAGSLISNTHKKQNGASNTTLAVIATTVVLDRPALTKIAQMAHDGMARAVFPVHTSLDGDIVFAISSRDGKQTKPAMSKSHLTDILGLMASDTLMVAIRESVMQSKTLPVC